MTPCRAPGQVNRHQRPLLRLLHSACYETQSPSSVRCSAEEKHKEPEARLKTCPEEPHHRLSIIFRFALIVKYSKQFAISSASICQKLVQFYSLDSQCGGDPSIKRSEAQILTEIWFENSVLLLHPLPPRL